MQPVNDSGGGNTKCHRGNIQTKGVKEQRQTSANVSLREIYSFRGWDREQPGEADKSVYIYSPLCCSI